MQEVRDRAPVLLLHGARTSRTMWRRQVVALERAGHRALAIDLPGHGTLDPARAGAGRGAARFTLERGVDAVSEGVDALGGRALVVGLSLGGYIGVEHRARRPEESLGLVAASCCSRPQTRIRTAWLALSRLLEASPDHGARINDLMVGLALDPEGAKDVADGGFALEAMCDVLREMGRCDPLRALALGRSPVWLVNGRWDHFRRDERRMLAAARSSGAPASLTIVPGATHLVSLDAPVAFTRVVLEALGVLAAVPAASPGRLPGRASA